MSDLLPCCKCGKSEGYGLYAGSTYRWWTMNCKACGGEFGEVRADRTVNLQNGPIPERWHYADDDWNDANKHAQGLREELATLEKSLAERWENINVQDGVIDGLKERIAELEVLNHALDKSAHKVADICTAKDEEIAALKGEMESAYDWKAENARAHAEQVAEIAALKSLLREAYGYTTAAGDLLPERIKAALREAGYLKEQG